MIIISNHMKNWVSTVPVDYHRLLREEQEKQRRERRVGEQSFDVNRARLSLSSEEEGGKDEDEARVQKMKGSMRVVETTREKELLQLAEEMRQKKETVYRDKDGRVISEEAKRDEKDEAYQLNMKRIQLWSGGTKDPDDALGLPCPFRGAMNRYGI